MGGHARGWHRESVEQPEKSSYRKPAAVSWNITRNQKNHLKPVEKTVCSAHDTSAARKTPHPPPHKEKCKCMQAARLYLTQEHSRRTLGRRPLFARN